MDKYGLVGFPLDHSFSKDFFNEKFKNEGIKAEYINYEISKIDNILEILNTTPKLKGINITIPYKEKIIPYLDSLSTEAKTIGAVNVVKILHKGNKLFLKGYNTDAISFKNSIKPLLESYHKKALILGTGGAAKAINYALTSLGIKTQYVSRTRSINSLSYNDVSTKIIHNFKLIVNCTPIGMYPNVDLCPNIPYKDMDYHTLLYDLIYNPDETLFMRKGKENGAIVKNGIEMLLLQAFESWKIWNENEIE